jgi:hypothetical protein
MMNSNQLYELWQIHEQEYMLESTVRRARTRNARQTIGLIAGAARRLRRRSDANQE